MKQINFLLFILSAILFSGCFSDRALEEKYFGVNRVELTASGALEIEGEYLDGSWGIAELRGKYSGNTLMLYGTVTHGGNSEIFRRLEKLPPHIEQVKVGSKVIWQRGKTDVNTELSLPSQRNSVKLVKFGSRACLPEPVEFLKFTEIFWGKESPEPFHPSGKPDEKFFNGKDFPGIESINSCPDTEILEIIGTSEIRSVDLSKLDLPELKKLLLYNVEVTGLEKAKLPALEIFSIDDFRRIPLGKVALPENLPKLHTVSIQSFAGNFDFDSLRGKPLKKLQIHGDFSNLDFLHGMKIEELKLSGFRMMPGLLESLSGLPLKRLKIDTRRVNDWSFLKDLKLEFLDITVGSDSNFSPELLKNMPLEVLRLHTAYIDCSQAWEKCRDLPLKELILRGGVVPENFLRSSKIERLGLYSNHWHTGDPEILFARMKKLKHLAVWRMIMLRKGRPQMLLDNRITWNRLPDTLESIRLPAANLNFMRRLPLVTRVALQSSSLKKVSLVPIADRVFDKLLFNYPPQDLKRYNIREKNPGKRDVFASEW